MRYAVLVLVLGIAACSRPAHKPIKPTDITITLTKAELEVWLADGRLSRPKLEEVSRVRLTCIDNSLLFRRPVPEGQVKLIRWGPDGPEAVGGELVKAADGSLYYLVEDGGTLGEASLPCFDIHYRLPIGARIVGRIVVTRGRE